tara:strand:+ start:5755 stop:6612 length:858 start_codon:yes stop_codon:yes gene_type:complete
MRVYKKKYIKKGFTTGGEWMVKTFYQDKFGERRETGEFEEYKGPITFYAGKPFGSENLSLDIELTQKLFPLEKRSVKQNFVYDLLKDRYAKNFKEPVPYKHKLTDKEKEKGEYSRYFVNTEHTNEIIEVDKEQFKYYKKQNTPYHIPVKFVELKLKITTSAIYYNHLKIQAARAEIKDIHKFVLPTEYMTWPFAPQGVKRDALNRRVYPTGESIPSQLPAAYQIGNYPDEQENSMIPPRQNCLSCIFFEEGWCDKFNAEVKENYWCAKYQYDVNDDPYYRPEGLV